MISRKHQNVQAPSLDPLIEAKVKQITRLKKDLNKKQTVQNVLARRKPAPKVFNDNDLARFVKSVDEQYKNAVNVERLKAIIKDAEANVEKLRQRASARQRPSERVVRSLSISQKNGSILPSGPVLRANLAKYHWELSTPYQPFSQIGSPGDVDIEPMVSEGRVRLHYFDEKGHVVSNTVDIALAIRKQVALAKRQQYRFDTNDPEFKARCAGVAGRILRTLTPPYRTGSDFHDVSGARFSARVFQDRVSRLPEYFQLSTADIVEACTTQSGDDFVKMVEFCEPTIHLNPDALRRRLKSIYQGESIRLRLLVDNSSPGLLDINGGETKVDTDAADAIRRMKERQAEAAAKAARLAEDQAREAERRAEEEAREAEDQARKAEREAREAEEARLKAERELLEAEEARLLAERRGLEEDRTREEIERKQAEEAAAAATREAEEAATAAAAAEVEKREAAAAAAAARDAQLVAAAAREARDRAAIAKISDAERSFIKDVFNWYDAQKQQDGFIWQSELSKALKETGRAATNSEAKERAREMIAEHDLNGDGWLTFDEFLLWCALSDVLGDGDWQAAKARFVAEKLATNTNPVNVTMRMVPILATATAGQRDATLGTGDWFFARSTGAFYEKRSSKTTNKKTDAQATTEGIDVDGVRAQADVSASAAATPGVNNEISEDPTIAKMAKEFKAEAGELSQMMQEMSSDESSDEELQFAVESENEIDENEDHVLAFAESSAIDTDSELEFAASSVVEKTSATDSNLEFAESSTVDKSSNADTGSELDFAESSTAEKSSNAGSSLEFAESSAIDTDSELELAQSSAVEQTSSGLDFAESSAVETDSGME